MTGVSTVHIGSLSKLQSLNGIFSIYKKQGPTSSDVLNTLKKDLLKEILSCWGVDTLDITGSVVEEKSYDHITKEAFEEKLKEFTGEIMQIPPLNQYSALKKDGKCIYVLLKQGQEVESKPAHPVTVYNLSLQDFSPPLFSLDVECGARFYVRSLIDDLGKGTDPDQAGSVHLGGACIEGGSLDIDRHLTGFAAMPKANRATEECKENKIKG